MKTRYYRLGIPPYYLLPSSIVFTDRKQAAEYARQENRFGPYRGRGVKVYPVDENGNLLLPAKEGKA